MGIIKKEYKVGDTVSYKLKKGDNIPVGKKEGDIIKGKIIKKDGDKVDIEWENKEVDQEVEEKILNEDVDIIKKLCMNKKSAVFEWDNYKIRVRGRVIEGYSIDESVLFKIYNRKYLMESKLGDVFTNFRKYLEINDLIFSDDISAKYDVEVSEKMFENYNDFLMNFYRFGKHNYKGEYKIGDYVFEYFVEIDGSGNQVLNYYVRNVE